MSAAVDLVLPELLKTLKGKLPAEVKELRASEGLDASGEPILWVWPVVEDKHFSVKLNKKLDDDIFDALMGKGPWGWVLVSPRTVTDQTSLDRAEDAEDSDLFDAPPLELAKGHGPPMINPQHRLAQADLLLAQRGRRQADLRAAVTAAYYALFHFLIQEACAFHVGRGREGRLLRATLARAFGHEEMKRASAGFASGNIPPILEAVLRGDVPPEGDKTRTPLHPDLKATARLFIKMQTLRHSADYDHMARFGAGEVRAHVDAVRAALEAWPALRHRPDTNLYLASLLSMDKLSKR